MKRKSKIWEYAESINWGADYMLSNGHIVLIQAYGQDKKKGLPLPKHGIPVKDSYNGQIVGFVPEYVD